MCPSNGTNVVTVDIYDVITKTWNSTTTGAGQISLARRYMAAASAGTKMVFAGGMYVNHCAYSCILLHALT